MDEPSEALAPPWVFASPLIWNPEEGEIILAGAGREVPRVAEFISPFQGFSRTVGRDPGFRPGLATLVRGCTLGWRISPFQGLGKLPPLVSNKFLGVRSSELTFEQPLRGRLPSRIWQQ